MNFLVLIMAVVSKTDIGRKIPIYFKFVKKMNPNVHMYDHFRVLRMYSMISNDQKKNNFGTKLFLMF